MARHELAAIGHQRHHAVLAEAVMESGKDIRADRYHQHPVEGIGGEDRGGWNWIDHLPDTLPSSGLLMNR